MSVTGDSNLIIYFIVEQEEQAFQDSIGFLNDDGEPQYLHQNDHRLKLYGLVNAGFYYAQASTPVELENKGVLVFYAPCYNYMSPEDGTGQLTTTLGFLSRLYQAVDPLLVVGTHYWRIEQIEYGAPEYDIPPVVSDDGLANNQIDHPTWLMIFPPEMVAEYGREWLLDLPAEYIEELDDGAIMTVATRAFPECDSDMEILSMIDDAVQPIEEAFQSREQ